jgi:hypothetical protein
MPEPLRTRAMRCAVYTRKSSEEGLEQEFNALQAQREACEAYIASQKQPARMALAQRLQSDTRTHAEWLWFQRARFMSTPSIDQLRGAAGATIQCVGLSSSSASIANSHFSPSHSPVYQPPCSGQYSTRSRWAVFGAVAIGCGRVAAEIKSRARAVAAMSSSGSLHVERVSPALPRSRFPGRS